MIRDKIAFPRKFYLASPFEADPCFRIANLENYYLPLIQILAATIQKFGIPIREAIRES